MAVHKQIPRAQWHTHDRQTLPHWIKLGIKPNLKILNIIEFTTWYPFDSINMHVHAARTKHQYSFLSIQAIRNCVMHEQNISAERSQTKFSVIAHNCDKQLSQGGHCALCELLYVEFLEFENTLEKVGGKCCLFIKQLSFFSSNENFYSTLLNLSKFV